MALLLFHWQLGNDPSTDLRACGFLGLMTLLHFLMDPERLTLAKEIYKLSLHETQVCVMTLMTVVWCRVFKVMLFAVKLIFFRDFWITQALYFCDTMHR